jgi:hypothetical protein
MLQRSVNSLKNRLKERHVNFRNGDIKSLTVSLNRITRRHSTWMHTFGSDWGELGVVSNSLSCKLKWEFLTRLCGKFLDLSFPRTVQRKLEPKAGIKKRRKKDPISVKLYVTFVLFYWVPLRNAIPYWNINRYDGEVSAFRIGNSKTKISPYIDIQLQCNNIAYEKKSNCTNVVGPLVFMRFHEELPFF